MEPYRIQLRAKEAAAGEQSVEGLRARLLRIPTVEALGDREYLFGEIDDDGQMRFELIGGSGDHFHEVEFVIPRGWVPRRGPQVFALVFMVRDWLGYEAFDPQIDDVLNKEAVLQGLVAMRQAQLNQKERQ